MNCLSNQREYSKELKELQDTNVDRQQNNSNHYIDLDMVNIGWWTHLFGQQKRHRLYIQRQEYRISEILE